MPAWLRTGAPETFEGVLGRVWPDRQEALAFALQVGQSAIMAQLVLKEYQTLGHAKTALAGDVAIIMADVRAMG